MSVMTSGRNAGAMPVRRRFPSSGGLCEGTHVRTLEGDLPVEYLCEGDMIVTRVGARALRRITARPLQDKHILVLRSAIGRGRPARDLYLAPGQAVHLADWHGSRIFGSDQRSIALAKLVDHDFIQWSEHPENLLVYELEFLTQQVFYAEGLEVMSADQPFRVIEGMAAA